MKKLLILCAFVFTAGVVSGQKCTKAEKAACAKTGKVCVKKTASASTDSETKVASALSVADLAAENDETIERKVCDYSGSISYYKKNVCEKSGKVSMSEVQYDDKANTFVNLSPKDAEMDDAKVVKTSVESETKLMSKKTKACCKGKAKACSKDKKGV